MASQSPDCSAHDVRSIPAGGRCSVTRTRRYSNSSMSDRRRPPGFVGAEADDHTHLNVVELRHFGARRCDRVGDPRSGYVQSTRPTAENPAWAATNASWAFSHDDEHTGTGRRRWPHPAHPRADCDPRRRRVELSSPGGRVEIADLGEGDGPSGRQRRVNHCRTPGGQAVDAGHQLRAGVGADLIQLQYRLTEASLLEPLPVPSARRRPQQIRRPPDVVNDRRVRRRRRWRRRERRTYLVRRHRGHDSVSGESGAAAVNRIGRLPASVARYAPTRQLVGRWGGAGFPTRPVHSSIPTLSVSGGDGWSAAATQPATMPRTRRVDSGAWL